MTPKLCTEAQTRVLPVPPPAPTTTPRRHEWRFARGKHTRNRAGYVSARAPRATSTANAGRKRVLSAPPATINRADEKPAHPGKAVRVSRLKPLGLNVTESARAPGVSRQALSNPVNGRAGMSAEMAIRLAKAFGSTTETWIRLQTAYDVAQAQARCQPIGDTCRRTLHDRRERVLSVPPAPPPSPSASATDPSRPERTSPPSARAS